MGSSRFIGDFHLPSMLKQSKDHHFPERDDKDIKLIQHKDAIANVKVGNNDDSLQLFELIRTSNLNELNVTDR